MDAEGHVAFEQIADDAEHLLLFHALREPIGSHLVL
jgi:hypothetical protein